MARQHLEYAKIYRNDLCLDTIDITKGKWFIQNTREDINDWILTNKEDDDPPYFRKVSDPLTLIRALSGIHSKSWVDPKRLVMGLMPAFNYFAHHGFGDIWVWRGKE